MLSLGFPQSRRYRHARGADRLGSVRRKLAAESKTSPLEVGFDLLQSIQPANDLFPFPFQFGSFHSALELLLEQQGQETAKHMASNSLIALVVNGMGFKDRFARTDNILDRPQCLVDVSDRLGIVDGVSP